jgi:NADPH:quinone reductase
MREIQAMRFGGPEVLEVREVPDPAPGPGQVVVEAAAVDTLTIETLIRRGMARQWFPVEPPYVPGGGVAGRVASVGDGVDPGWAGRNVVTRAVANGAYAERVVATADGLVPVPDGLALPDAAALIHDGTTAISVHEPSAVKPGDRVLITAAGGGMGILLVQLAHAAGAHVIAAARGRGKLDLIRELGAEVAIDYSEPDWTAKARAATGGEGVNVLWDGAGGELGTTAF